MFKIKKSMNVEMPNGSEAVVRCGMKTAWIDAYEDDNIFLMTYDLKGHEVSEVYSISEEGIEEAIWEWLCNLSRITNERNERTLGSMRGVL